jgi:hypothetical protein
LGPHAYIPGTSPTGVFWTTPVPEHSIKINLEEGTASLRLRNLPVFDYFTVPNSLDPVHLQGVAAATLHTLQVEWSGVTQHREYNDPASSFAGVFLETAARISVVVTTSAVPAHDIHGFRFVSDPLETSSSSFAEIGQEQNGAFFPAG